MNRSLLYGLCHRWGKWASSLDGGGITGIALFMNANTGDRCGVKSADLMYSFPDNDIKSIHEAIEKLSDEDKSIVLAHFKRDFSYSRIAGIVGKSKSWVQKKINEILKNLDFLLDGESIRVYA